jgi:hypothetical protein
MGVNADFCRSKLFGENSQTREFYHNDHSRIFDDINKLEDVNQDGLKFNQLADMISLQKTIKRGGQKNNTFCCYCFKIQKNFLQQVNLLPCHAITSAVSDEVVMERLKVEKLEHESAWPYLLHVSLPIHCSTINFGTGRLVVSNTDPRHIEFQGASLDLHVQHVRLLEKKLYLHEIPPV